MAWVLFGQPLDPLRRELLTSTTIGRHPRCDVQVLDKGVSKVHCEIHRRDGQYWLQDRGSMNGTLLNGKRIAAEVRLGHGDRIQVGSAVGVFEDPEARDHRSLAAKRSHELSARKKRAKRSPVEQGLLTLQRDGDLHVRLWGVAVGRGGFVAHIPLVGDRPPSSRLLVYPGKAGREDLCLEPDDAPFEALLAEAKRDGASLPERERTRYLADVVYRRLGARLSKAQQDACLAACAAFKGRRMPIGELLRLGAGVCRHRAFLFFHLARKLGLQAEMFRGEVASDRHAWNEVRIGVDCVFVDTSLGIVMDAALDAERELGYAASRLPGRTDGEPPASAVLVAGGSGGEPVVTPAFRHELRKVPGDEEAVLLLYPEGELPAVRFLHVHLRAGPQAAAMFAMAPFLSGRIFAIVGDEAHHLWDAIDPCVMRELSAR